MSMREKVVQKLSQNGCTNIISLVHNIGEVGTKQQLLWRNTTQSSVFVIYDKIAIFVIVSNQNKLCLDGGMF